MKIAVLTVVSLQPSCASEWSDDLVQLFVRRGVPESVIRSGRGFSVTSMSPDGVTTTIKAPVVLKREPKFIENPSTVAVSVENELAPNTSSDTLIVQSSRPKKILTQQMIGERYKCGAKQGCVCFKNGILENVEFGEEGHIISGKIISGFIEQNGLIYGPETIFTAGLADRPDLQF